MSSTLLNLAGIVVLLFIFLFGALRYQINDRSYQANHFTNHLADSLTYIGVVQEAPKVRRVAKTEVSLSVLCDKDNNCKKVSGLVLIYFPNGDSSSHLLKAGDLIAYRSRHQLNQKPRNPNTFDYQTYLKYRHITHKAYIKNPSLYQVLDHRQLSYFRQFAFNIRERCLDILSSLLKDKDHLAISSAMILGFRNHIDQELYNTFTDSGSVHVLAVSGLHVGVICAVLMYLFSKWRSRSKKVKLLKWIIIGLLVTLYVLVTGAAPAVTRASIMFMIILVGKYFFSYYNTINILSLTAIIMLLWDPYLLFQASFQFSFLALTSLVTFHPIIMRRVPLPYEWCIKPMELLAVAFAAQVLVFPITIYFFHKFPTYFPLSGLFAVPLAILTLKSGLLLLIFSWVPYLDRILLWLHTTSLDFLIYSIEGVKYLPYYSIENLWLDKSELICIYSTIIFIMVFLKTRNLKHFHYACICFTLGCIATGNWHYERNQQIQLTIYDAYNASIVDIHDGRNVITYKSIKENIEIDESFINKNHRYARGMKTQYQIHTDSVKQFERAYQHKNLIITKYHTILIAEGQNTSLDKIKMADYIILRTSYLKVPTSIDLSHKTILLDRTSSKGQVDFWIKECKKRNARLLSVQEHGAIRIDLTKQNHTEI